MKVTLRKGHHRQLIPTFGIFYNKKTLERLVTFHANCAYKIEGVDQYDINKLVGIGYPPHHHKESARFGWRYNKETNGITLFAYCYVSGKREERQIADVPMEQEIKLKIYISASHYCFDVQYDIIQHWCIVQKKHTKKWAYLLGPFFGGNRKTPQDMHITLKKPKT